MTITRVSLFLGAALGLAALAAPASSSLAADIDYGAGSIKDTYAPPAPSGRVWYFRGYSGFANYDSEPPTTELHNDFFSSQGQNYEIGGIFGFGMGAQLNRWLRFDVTGEYRGNATFHGLDKYDNDVDPTQCDPGDPQDCGTNDYEAVVSGWVGLASAYIDICTWRGITPFVGGGVGVAVIDVKGMTDTNVRANSVFFGDDQTTTNFAWAVHAGLAYEVTPSFTVDIGYRYIEMGDVTSGVMAAFDNTSSYKGVALNDLHSHDLLVGMRWKLDQPAAYPVAMK